jgi:hypothetical protein
VVVGRYCACEILIANPIDWLYAACLEYFIFFSIDSSDARKQYDEYCLSIICCHLISIRLYFILTILITEDDQNHIFFLAIATHTVD